MAKKKSRSRSNRSHSGKPSPGQKAAQKAWSTRQRNEKIAKTITPEELASLGRTVKEFGGIQRVRIAMDLLERLQL